MADTTSLAEKRDLLLAEERRFASQVSQRVIDKPRLAVWMILIPVFFVFYFWQLKRYADGRKAFAENFLVTRRRAIEEAHRAAVSGRGPVIDDLVNATDVLPQLHPEYRRWVTLLVEHYHDLFTAHGSTYAALVRSVYKRRSNYLLFLNRLDQVEREFDAALKPHLDPATENAGGIIKLMETSAADLRRKRAEAIFP